VESEDDGLIVMVSIVAIADIVIGGRFDNVVFDVAVRYFFFSVHSMLVYNMLLLFVVVVIIDVVVG